MGGEFTRAGSTLVNRIARWDGTNWTGLGTGADERILGLRVHVDDEGTALFAAGMFTSVDGLAANRLARWDGVRWRALGSGVANGYVRALASHEFGGGTALLVGGKFVRVPDSGDGHLAAYGCDQAAPVLELPLDLELSDRWVDGTGEVVHFEVSASDRGDPSPRVSAIPPSGSRFPPGRTVVQCQAIDAAGNVAVGSFAVVVRSRLSPR